MDHCNMMLFLLLDPRHRSPIASELRTSTVPSLTFQTAVINGTTYIDVFLHKTTHVKPTTTANRYGSSEVDGEVARRQASTPPVKPRSTTDPPVDREL